MWWPFQFITHLLNEIRKEAEQRRYLSLELYDQITDNGERVDPVTQMIFSNHGIDDPYKNKKDYVEVNGCHVIIFDNQMDMIENGILKVTWEYDYDHNKDEYRNTDEFEKWLAENLRGYYRVWGFGNGRAKPNQKYAGIWRLEVRCMRQEDAFTVRMVWL